ncbi:hypothetical protein DVB69_17135 [Sporosarcina sp. BI001-red]|uniref:hypothetical protein n=1 Tax=Sporosarcina sp. BI001-red TaxID=2282866 RepID=UPI000E27C24B|nr:hypothetical protein [Sporosarcina sp. BI001-red]REB04804.1 hypothetical protein DVB69_17135 [Sporosarcina sp. BI001-red]
MFDDFKIIEPLFEDQVHELNQFSLVIEGEEYTGILESGEITWYHPQPQQALLDRHVKEVEEKVHEITKKQL